MTAINAVTLRAPSLEYTGVLGGIGDKRVHYLENMALLYESLPTDAEIIGAGMWSQQSNDHPTGCFGDMGLMVDRGVYSNLACVPLEKCQPCDFDTLARLTFRPGADVMDMRSFADEPVIYRPGYRLFTAFEVSNANGRAFSIFPWVRVRSATGFVPLTGVVFHDLPNRWGTDVSPYSFRSVIAGLPEGGTEIRVTVQSLWGPCTFSHVSVGVRSGSSGFNMAAAPVQLSFDGAPGLAMDLNASKRSAWAPLITTPGCSLLVHTCVGGGPYKDGTAVDSVFAAGTSGHDQMNFTGASQAGRSHLVAMVEVR